MHKQFSEFKNKVDFIIKKPKREREKEASNSAVRKSELQIAG